MKNLLINLGLLLLLGAVLAAWTLLPPLAVLAGTVALALWMALTRAGRQAAAVTWVGVRSVRQRLGSSLVIVIGIAGVVGVLVALLAMGQGFQSTLQSGGRDDTAIVLRGGSSSEAQSVMLRDDVDAIAQAPGIARDREGKPLLSAELVVAATLPRRDGSGDGNVQFRGVDATAWRLRPNMKIVEGRAFTPGTHELVVGQSVRREFSGLDVNREVKIGTARWKVVGVFASGDGYDSELWADRRDLADDYRRGNSAQSVLVRLTGADAFKPFKAALSADPKLKVEVQTTRQFFAQQSESIAKVIRAVGLTVGLIMAIGAVFGALNCMFAAVAARAREIATLRAIGFRGGPVVVSVMLETMLLALLGGLFGGLLVWLVFDDYTASTLQGFTDVMFRFKVSPQLLWDGLKWALGIGLVGGLFPALRAARLPVTEALRSA